MTVVPGSSSSSSMTWSSDDDGLNLKLFTIWTVTKYFLRS